MTDLISAERRPKIWVFTGFFTPHKGGVENYVYEVFRRLIRFDVTIVTINTEGAAVEETMENLKIIRLPGWNLVGRSYPVPKPTVETFRLCQKIWDEPIDLINTHTRFFLTSFLGFILARLKRIPLLHTEHGSGRTRHASWLIEWIEWLYDLTLGRLVVWGADQVLGVSKAAAEFAQTLGARQSVEVVYNGVDSRAFQQHSSFKLAKQSQQSKLTVTYIGRLMKAKGPDLLIRAVKLLSKPVNLILIGGGPMEAELKKLAGEDQHIQLKGSQERSEIPNYLHQTDIFVLPTSTHPEGLPTSILEAGAARRAVIATDLGGTCEVIHHHETGLLIPPNDLPALTSAIERLITDSKLRSQLAINLEKLVREKFDWGVLAPRYEDQIERLL